MAAKRNGSSNGHTRLDEAMATLLQTQAAFVASQADTNARIADSDARQAENERRQAENERQHIEYQRQHIENQRRHAEDTRALYQRMDRIESQLVEVVRVLTDHSRQLERLTEAVRDRIGFKAAPVPS